MSVFSSLIGKTVTATTADKSKQITGKVLNVQLLNGQAALNVDGTIVPTNNLIKIEK